MFIDFLIEKNKLRGILTFSNKTSEINERKLKVDYVKAKKPKENEGDNENQKLLEMTHKLNELKAKEKEMDKIIANHKTKENKFTLIHKYNEIKVFYLNSRFPIFIKKF